MFRRVPASEAGVPGRSAALSGQQNQTTESANRTTILMHVHAT